MALSYYSNCGPLHHLNQELTQPELLPPELLNFDDNYLLSDTCIDPLFDQNSFFYSENTLTPPPLPLPPQQPQIFESYPYPKRIKTQDDYYYSDIINYNYDYDVFVPNLPVPPEFSPELLAPSPEFQAGNTILPQVYSCGSVSNAEHTSNVKKASGGSLSAQSIAARLRRRKITEKTQELGKLIPGGQKMNTAEMFQAASKYIKFLQVQVGILELMGSTNDKENEEPLHSPELQALVTSPLVQEKLYSAEKCLVPRKFVETLAEKRELQTNPQLIKDIIQLL